MIARDKKICSAKSQGCVGHSPGSEFHQCPSKVSVLKSHSIWRRISLRNLSCNNDDSRYIYIFLYLLIYLSFECWYCSNQNDHVPIHHYPWAAPNHLWALPTPAKSLDPGPPEVAISLADHEDTHPFIQKWYQKWSGTMM